MTSTTVQSRRRTRTERRQKLRALALGLSITGLVIAMDHAGKLQQLDYWFFDERVRLCQFFRKTPTDRLVHVDIDDGALETVGRWPWHRSILADVVDELGLAGVKAVAFDVVMSEPEQPEWHENGTVTDHDRVFADACKRMGNVLVPASLTFQRPTAGPESVEAVEVELARNLELSHEEINASLAARGQPTVSQDQYVHSLRAAMALRVRQELSARDQPIEELEAKLLPQKSRFFPNAPQVRILVQSDLQFRAERALEKFTLPLTTRSPLLHALQAIAPLPQFAAAARYGGIVDQPPLGDGVVRAVPLMAEFHNRLLPQIGLVLACAALDVEPHAIIIRDQSVDVPTPDGFNITIPLREFTTRDGRFGMFMDVPWFGTRDYLMMYGAPGRQHVNIGVILELAGWRHRLVVNNKQIDDAVLAVLNIVDNRERIEAFKALKAAPADFETRRQAARQAIEDPNIVSAIEAIRAVPASEREEVYQRGLTGFDTLPLALEQNASFVKLIAEREATMRRQLDGRVVLIGSTASSSTDLVNTPLGTQVPGVVAHGVVVNAILTRQLWRDAPPYVTFLYTLATGVLATISVSLLKPWRATIAATVLLLGYLVLDGIVLFDRGNYLVGTAGPATAIVLVWVGENLISLVVETTERARVTNRFRTRVDPQLVDYVLEHPERIHLDGEMKELTVVFTDLEGFTAASEKLGEETVQVLNEYLKRMVPLIRARNGYLNKFLGDGIMFVFGAPFDNPNHAADAVDTVLDMMHATDEFSGEMVARGLPAVIMRAGVSTGRMIVGDAGADTASDYTVLGDAVNTGARLEKANKRFDSRIMISGGTFRHLDSRFLVRPIGALMLAGKSEPVEGYEVLARATEATVAQRRLKECSESIVKKFAEGDSAGCLELVESMQEELGASKFLATYEQLCRRALEEQAALQKYVLA